MRILLFALTALASTAALAAPSARPMQAAGLPAGPGQKQTLAACSGCHALATITGKQYSAKKWGEVVDSMADRGAAVSDADYDVIVAYLAGHFGPKK